MTSAEPAGSPVPAPLPSPGEDDSAPVTTRERILDTALDLFARKGYAETSLREIAAELGFSKAAIYYHFESKRDILAALHLRLHRLSDHLAPVLAEPDDSGDLWNRVIDVLIGVALENRKLLEVHIRNQEALAEIHRDAGATHPDTSGDMDEWIGDLLTDRSAPVEVRVRRAASLGAIGAVLLGAGGLADVPDADLEDMLRQVAHHILEMPVRRPRGRGRRAPGRPARATTRPSRGSGPTSEPASSRGRRRSR